MTIEECQEVYNYLTSFLDEKGLLWLVEQVEDTIRQGITEEQEVETLKTKDYVLEEFFDEADATKKLRRGPKVKFPVTREYSEKERLSLLLDAIEQTTINTYEMECEVLIFMNTNLTDDIKVEFYSNDDLKTILNKENIGQRSNVIPILKGLLEDLRKEL